MCSASFQRLRNVTYYYFCVLLIFTVTTISHTNILTLCSITFSTFICLQIFIMYYNSYCVCMQVHTCVLHTFIWYLERLSENSKRCLEMLNVYSMENCQKSINVSSIELWILTLSVHLEL